MCRGPEFAATAPPIGCSPPPGVHVRLQGKEQVGEEPLVHGRPLKLRDAEHGGAWPWAELPPLLLRHGHPTEAQVHPQVPLHLAARAPVHGLRSRWKDPE